MKDREQKINLLNKVVTVLDKNKIDYVIYYGTLLGAIRNNDFIAWDNDIDIQVYDIDSVTSIKKDFEEQGLDCIPTQNNTISFIDTELCKKIDFRVWIEPFVKKGNEFFVRIDKDIEKKCGVTSTSNLSYLLGFPYLVLSGVSFKTKNFSYEQMQLITTMSNKLPRMIRKVISTFFIKLQSITMNIQYINIPSFNIRKINFCGIVMSIPDNAEKHLEIFYGKKWRFPDKNWTTVRDNRQRHDWKKVIRNNKEFLYYLPLIEGRE